MPSSPTPSFTAVDPADRPAFVCLHALGASRREFDHVSRRLAGVGDVLALDLPGFGAASTAHGTTVDDMVRGVARAIRRGVTGRLVLVGHSMGGKVATLLAARLLAGDEPVFGLAGVVLLAGSPPSPEPMDEERRERMLGWASDGPLDTDSARRFIDANVGSPLDPDDDATMVDDLTHASREAWVAWLTRGSREDRSGEVGELDVPALLVAGGADGDLGPDAQRELNGPVYPRATVEVLGGAGHLLPLERPDEVARLLERFWRERAGLGPVVPPEHARMLAGPRTTARMRGILARRALADDPDREPLVLTREQLATLTAVAEALVPQDGPPIDLAARVDVQLHRGIGDGWRNAELPPDPEAYRRALDALAPVTGLPLAERTAVLDAIAAGDGPRDALVSGGLTPEQLSLWLEDATVDLVRVWLSHPATLARIGFDGWSNGGDDGRLTGFQLLGAGEREGWEPLAGLPVHASGEIESIGEDAR